MQVRMFHRSELSWLAAIPRHHRNTTATAFGDNYGRRDTPICRDSA
jgi:hypothetical protein